MTKTNTTELYYRNLQRDSYKKSPSNTKKKQKARTKQRADVRHAEKVKKQTPPSSSNNTSSSANVFVIGLAFTTMVTPVFSRLTTPSNTQNNQTSNNTQNSHLGNVLFDDLRNIHGNVKNNTQQSVNTFFSETQNRYNDTKKISGDHFNDTRNSLNNIKDEGETIFNKTKDTIQVKWNSTKEVATDIKDKITNATKNAFSYVKGKNITETIQNRSEKAIENIKNKTSEKSLEEIPEYISINNHIENYKNRTQIMFDEYEDTANKTRTEIEQIFTETPSNKDTDQEATEPDLSCGTSEKSLFKSLNRVNRNQCVKLSKNINNFSPSSAPIIKDKLLDQFHDKHQVFAKNIVIMSNETVTLTTKQIKYSEELNHNVKEDFITFSKRKIEGIKEVANNYTDMAKDSILTIGNASDKIIESKDQFISGISKNIETHGTEIEKIKAEGLGKLQNTVGNITDVTAGTKDNADNDFKKHLTSVLVPAAEGLKNDSERLYTATIILGNSTEKINITFTEKLVTEIIKTYNATIDDIKEIPAIIRDLIDSVTSFTYTFFLSILVPLISAISICYLWCSTNKQLVYRKRDAKQNKRTMVFLGLPNSKKGKNQSKDTESIEMQNLIGEDTDLDKKQRDINKRLRYFLRTAPEINNKIYESRPALNPLRDAPKKPLQDVPKNPLRDENFYAYAYTDDQMPLLAHKTNSLLDDSDTDDQMPLSAHKTNSLLDDSDTDDQMPLLAHKTNSLLDDNQIPLL